MSARSTDDYAPSAEFYDHIPYYRDRSDIGFYVEEALHAKGPVLEVACGSGRVLIPTARAGVTTVGLDASAQMLARCRASLETETEDVRARVTLVHRDMRDFDLGRTFPLITLPFRAFQHLLTVEDQIACLASVHRHVAHEGRFIVDLFNPSLEMLVNKEASPTLAAALDESSIPSRCGIPSSSRWSTCCTAGIRRRTGVRRLRSQSVRIQISG